ncbi:MAG: hypothetical protein QM599_09325 [Pseudoxanthomonas sp.]
MRQRPSSRRLSSVVVALLWLASLGALWWFTGGGYAAPGAGNDARGLHAARRELKQLREKIAELAQREATLSRSDQISRRANADLQGTLAERDQEIASLRSDVAFYERLVGPTAERHGLNVFSSEFANEGGSAWQYRIVLTQNLNRGAISAGRMRFAVEGTRDGRAATLDWAQLHPDPGAPEQPYSFRYFQQLEGSVTLPAGFVPQRVRVSLHGDDVAIERDFSWKASAPST